MTRLLELAARLTPPQLREVEDFAEFLSSRPAAASTSSSSSVRTQSRINVDALVGLCKGMGGDKSDKELLRDAWDEVIDKLDK